MIPINKVKSIIKNYEQLEKELASETSDKKLSQFITCFWSTLYDEAHTL